MPRPATASLQVSATPAEVALAAAELFTESIVSAVAARGQARVAISGGSTPKAMFALLADPQHSFLARVPWASLQLFWVDERCVPPTADDSNFRMTNEAMLSKVPLPPANVHRMEGELDPAVAAARYESAIRNAFKLEGAETPTFDLILLGMGDDGHTASLFPHTEALDNMIDIVIANHVPQKDTWRITLTWPVINQGRTVAFLIEGKGKDEVLQRVLQGPYDPETLPSQLIRPSSKQLTFLLDSEAAKLLPGGGAPGTTTLELA
ncbi:6-phosphogluconolactonase [Granulicella sp. WH15]|uniref:6-phosphogluconolactonase n=1 Tax=Granulicella sp. WH15 TaxID=2602070 RepID=UPI00136792E4|nr:6-phosphogluconolactonase [Granulicella sp. WH15]QHN05068.1 6-phosphogluconolactonase [Granulicella sp. WH15]